MVDTTTTLHVRRLRDEDFDAVAAIATANFPDDPRTGGELRDKYAEFDERRFAREWVVAEPPSGSVAGYAFWAHVTWSFHPDKYVVYTAVDPRRQRQGIGTRLMETLVARLRERGARRLRTWTREDYDQSLRFLGRFGFAEYDRAFESRLPVAGVDLTRFADARGPRAADRHHHHDPGRGTGPRSRMPLGHLPGPHDDGLRCAPGRSGSAHAAGVRALAGD